MPTLTWERTGGQRLVFSLAPIETTIGRDAGNAVRIESEYVSKRHAIVRLGADGYSITDLNSSNGTRVNGRPVATAALKDGDRIELGSEVLTFAGGLPGHQAASRPSRKGLLLVAGGGGAIILLLLILIVVGGSPAPNAPSGAAPARTSSAAPEAAIPSTLDATPPPSTPAPAATPPVAPPPATPPAPAPSASSGLGGTEGVLPSNDPTALYDMAMSHVKGGRLVEARRLLVASLKLDPRNQSALQRLREVEGTIQIMVDRHLANGQRAFSYLRYQDAILEWEQVLSMTEPNDARRAQAAAGIGRARERLGR